MSANVVLYLLGIAVVTQVGAAIILDNIDVDNVDDYFTKILKDKTDKLIKQIEDATIQFYNNTSIVLERNSLYIDSAIASAITLYHSKQEKCVHGIEAELQALKIKTISDFLKCANLTSAMTKASKLVEEGVIIIGKITAQVITILYEVSKCKSVIPIFCWIPQFSKIKKYVGEDIKLCDNYVHLFNELFPEILKEIGSCFKHVQQEIEEKIQEINTRVEKCEKAGVHMGTKTRLFSY